MSTFRRKLSRRPDWVGVDKNGRDISEVCPPETWRLREIVYEQGLTEYDLAYILKISRAAAKRMLHSPFVGNFIRTTKPKLRLLELEMGYAVPKYLQPYGPYQEQVDAIRSVYDEDESDGESSGSPEAGL